jgi:hypothetical protein
LRRFHRSNAYPHDNRHVTVTSRAPDIPHRIRPLVTTGLAWDKGPFTVTGDVDLTETKRFKTQENSLWSADRGIPGFDR